MDDGWMMDQVSVCTKILNVLLLCHWCHTLNFISTWSCFNIYIIVLLRVRSARSGERDNSTIVYNLHTFIWSLQNSLFNTVKVRKVSEWKRTCYWCKVKESNQWWSIISILFQIWDLAPDDKCWIIHMLNCTRAELYECWVVRMLNCTSADSSRLTIQKAAPCTLHIPFIASSFLVRKRQPNENPHISSRGIAEETVPANRQKDPTLDIPPHW